MTVAVCNLHIIIFLTIFCFPQRKSSKKLLNTLMKFKMKLTGNKPFKLNVSL